MKFSIVWQESWLLCGLWNRKMTENLNIKFVSVGYFYPTQKSLLHDPASPFSFVFPPLPSASLLYVCISGLILSQTLCYPMDFSSAICKASSDNHFAFLHFFLGMVLVSASCTTLQTSLPIVLQALCLQDLIPWIESSLPLSPLTPWRCCCILSSGSLYLLLPQPRYLFLSYQHSLLLFFKSPLKITLSKRPPLRTLNKAALALPIHLGSPEPAWFPFTTNVISDIL